MGYVEFFSYSVLYNCLKFYLKGINNFVDIELAKRRLATLSVVTRVEILLRTPDMVQFHVNHTGSMNDFRKALELDSAFKAYQDPRDFYQIINQDELEYQWQGL